MTVATASAGCDMGKITVNTTSKVLARAQPSLKQEADYELAARALPGTLKTVEGFWVVDPGNARLLAILTEGYCQYGIGFVEDEWEEALARKDFDTAQYHSTRATKMFIRCMNYALKQLGGRWQEGLFADNDTVKGLVDRAGSGQRNPLMWAGIAMGSLINQNKDNVELVAQLPTAKMILQRIVEMDAKSRPRDPMLAATPHVALGLVYTAAGPTLGGDAKKATEHFLKALELTNDKFLLARVHYAKRVGVMTQDRKLFREQLLKVLQTDPAIWPEQRLANEIAHRKARRYLRMEKELF
ncbi:MAG TPA: TRAP transporter TatT component family protein [Kofleriaceae bacterium]|nr:TRAP transporter TatT component family protein [Kofleriaceae bacterium]